MAKMLKSQILRERKKKHDIKEQMLIENQNNDDDDKSDYDDDESDYDDDESDYDDDESDYDDDESDYDDDESDYDDDESDYDDDESESDDDESESDDDESESDDHRKSKRKPMIIKDLLASLVIPKGEYDAMITDITFESPQGKHSKYILLTVHLIVLVNGNELELNDRMSLYLSEDSRLGKLFLAILGKIPKSDFDLSSIIDEEVGVRITHRKDEKGRIWPEVEYLR